MGCLSSTSALLRATRNAYACERVCHYPDTFVLFSVAAAHASRKMRVGAMAVRCWHVETVALECGDSNYSLWCPLWHFTPVPRDPLSHMSFVPRLCHASPPSSALPNCGRIVAALFLLLFVLGLYSRPPPRAAGREWEPSCSRNQRPHRAHSQKNTPRPSPHSQLGKPPC